MTTIKISIGKILLVVVMNIIVISTLKKILINGLGGAFLEYYIMPITLAIYAIILYYIINVLVLSVLNSLILFTVLYTGSTVTVNHLLAFLLSLGLLLFLTKKYSLNRKEEKTITIFKPVNKSLFLEVHLWRNLSLFYLIVSINAMITYLLLGKTGYIIFLNSLASIIYILINIIIGSLLLIYYFSDIGIIENKQLFIKPIIVYAVLCYAGPLSTVPILYSFLTINTSPITLKKIHQYFTNDKTRGIHLGLAEAVLVHDRVKCSETYFVNECNKYQEKTWYWKKYDQELYLNYKKLPNKHIVIMGSSGTGKSLLAKHLAIEYFNKTTSNIIIIDPHDEYIVLKKYINNIKVIDASKYSINPLEIGRLNPRDKAHQISSTISTIFNLGPLQRQLLEEIVLTTYIQKGIDPANPETWKSTPPTISDLINTCKKLSEKSPEYRRVYPYLKILHDNVFKKTLLKINDILNNPTIISLTRLSSDYVRTLYTTTLLQKILDSMYLREISKEQILIIDEAHNLLIRGFTREILSKLYMESRKFGLGLVLITPYPLYLPFPVIENSAIKIVFNINEPKNLNYVTKLLARTMDKDELNAIRYGLKNLKIYQYILSITGLNEIFIVNEKHNAQNIIKAIKGDQAIDTIS